MDKFLNALKKVFGFLGRDIITLLLLIAVLAGGLYLGYLSGFGAGKAAAPTATDEHAAHKDQDAEPTTWTCSMHPQIQLPKPGKCPLCGMDLIPLKKGGGDDGPRTLVMSPASMALAEIETRPAERKYVTHTVRMVGKVQFDETRLSYITAWFPGRLDRLYVDYTGVTVSKGDHMVYIYSPELLTAQQELLGAIDALPTEANADQSLRRMAESLVRSAEEKLRLWGLSVGQIASIKEKRKEEDHMTINSPVSGIVIHKNALEGMWVKTGTKIYTIADLTKLWVYLDAYESDLPWVHYSQEVEFRTEAYPDKAFIGRIAFISPVLDEKTRAVRVRVNVDNENGMLKPGMFVRASIKARIARKGTVINPTLAGKWICPMHPEIIKDSLDTCDLCGMDLVPIEKLYKTDVVASAPEPLVIPASAPLLTGRRAVVYVKVKDAEKPTFEGREIVIGSRAGDYYLVEKGLEEGDLVVVRGNFVIDSALQIQAKPSMMMPPEEDQRPETREQRPRTYGADETFTKSLIPFLDKYLALQEALAADDLEAAKAHVRRLPELLEQADASTLKGMAAMGWKRSAKKIAKALEHAAHMTDLEGIRKLNIKLSDTWIGVVQSFSVTGDKKLHIARCPMANDNKGADWLQLTEEVRNPYYGASMLTCGSIRKTISTGDEEVGGNGEPKEPQPSEPSRLESDATFRASLNTFLAHYLALQSALASDDAKKSTESLLKLPGALKGIGAEGLKGDSTEKWRGLQKSLAEALEHAGHATDIKGIRELNIGLSNAAIRTVEAFGAPGDKPVYLAFCPMAGDGGASWLQAGDELLNPYYGAEMLYCGEIKKKIEPRKTHEGHEH